MQGQNVLARGLKICLERLRDRMRLEIRVLMDLIHFRSNLMGLNRPYQNRRIGESCYPTFFLGRRIAAQSTLCKGPSKQRTIPTDT